MLFTLDKLIFRLVKQMQTLVMNGVSLKIWELYEYEKARSFAPTDELYRSNGQTILRDENYFHVKRGSDRKVSFTLMDTPCPEMKTGILRPGFGEYVRTFIGELTETKAEDKGCTPVYLRRDLIPGDQLRHLSECFVENGLECKLLCETSKLLSIQDTGDLLHRRKRKRDQGIKQASQAK